MKKQKTNLISINQPLFNYWHALYMTFYSKKLYQDVCIRWRGYGIVYLLLLITILALPFSMQFEINFFKSFADSEFTWLNKSMSAILLYPIIISFLFGLMLSFMLLLAIIAQGFSWLIFKIKLNFKDALRILTIASTPALTVFILSLSTNHIVPGIGLFCLILSSIYFSYAILAFKAAGKKNMVYTKT